MVKRPWHIDIQQGKGSALHSSTFNSTFPQVFEERTPHSPLDLALPSALRRSE